MNTTEYYNFLDGKNLCNIFASLIVKKINESVPNAKTEISVINVRNFFIVKGKTSSDKPLMVADIFQEFTSKYSEDLSKTIRVIDIINYTTDPEYDSIDIDYQLKKDYNDFNIQKFVNSFVDKNIYFNLKLDKSNLSIYYDCLSEKNDDVVHILKSKFSDYKLFKSDFSQETYISEKFYGLSNNNEKLYHMALKHIFHNISMVGITKELNVKLTSENKISSIDNENINLFIYNDNHIVKTPWLTSLILDVFPFTVSELTELYLSSEINHVDDVINDDDNAPWKKLNMVGDLILF